VLLLSTPLPAAATPLLLLLLFPALLLPAPFFSGRGELELWCGSAEGEEGGNGLSLKVASNKNAARCKASESNDDARDRVAAVSTRARGEGGGPLAMELWSPNALSFNSPPPLTAMSSWRGGPNIWLDASKLASSLASMAAKFADVSFKLPLLSLLLRALLLLLPVLLAVVLGVLLPLVALVAILPLLLLLL